MLVAILKLLNDNQDTIRALAMLHAVIVVILYVESRRSDVSRPLFESILTFLERLLMILVSMYIVSIVMTKNKRNGYTLLLLIAVYIYSKYVRENMMDNKMSTQESNENADDNADENAVGSVPKIKDGYTPRGVDFESADLNPELENCLAKGTAGDLTAPCDSIMYFDDELSAQGLNSNVKGFSGTINGASLSRYN